MWSPTCSVGIIDPLGILNASTTKARSASATATATRIDSRYSRTSLLRHGRRRMSTCPSARSQRVVERLLVERALVHRRAERVQVRRAAPRAPSPGRSRTIAFSCFVEQGLRLVEQPAGSLELRPAVRRQIGAERRVGEASQRQHVPGGPQGHLEEREDDDPHRDLLLASVRLDGPQEGAVLGAEGGRQRPDEGVGQGEREQDEPGSPVERSQEAMLLSQEGVGLQGDADRLPPASIPRAPRRRQMAGPSATTAIGRSIWTGSRPHM